MWPRNYLFSLPSEFQRQARISKDERSPKPCLTTTLSALFFMSSGKSCKQDQAHIKAESRQVPTGPSATACIEERCADPSTCAAKRHLGCLQGVDTLNLELAAVTCRWFVENGGRDPYMTLGPLYIGSFPSSFPFLHSLRTNHQKD